MVAGGWISLYRKIQSHWLWTDKPFTQGQAWVDLLLLASYEEKIVFSKGESVTIKRGAFLTSDHDLEERWGWSRNKVRRFLDLLIKDGMIELKRTPRGTTLTIVNYDSYQTSGTTKSTGSSIGTSGLEPEGGTTESTTLDVNSRGSMLGTPFDTTKGTTSSLAISWLEPKEGPTFDTTSGTTARTLLINLNNLNNLIKDNVTFGAFEQPHGTEVIMEPKPIVQAPRKKMNNIKDYLDTWEKRGLTEL